MSCSSQCARSILASLSLLTIVGSGCVGEIDFARESSSRHANNDGQDDAPGPDDGRYDDDDDDDDNHVGGPSGGSGDGAASDDGVDDLDRDQGDDYVIPSSRGMDMPWIEHQAEDAVTNGTVLGPSRKKWDANHIEAEAVGRKAVRLDDVGEYVEFTTTAPTNSIVVRLSIPDAPSGGGIDATLSVFVGDKKLSLPVTSRYSWTYKGNLIGDPIVDIPAEDPHAFFDEAHMMFDEVPAGTKIRLEKTIDDHADFYIIDLVDFELVPPPAEMPPGFVSIHDFGVLPDGKNHGPEMLAAMQSNQNLWIPPGEYIIESFGEGVQNVGLDNNAGVEIRGAGMWHSVLKGRKVIFFCNGPNTSCKYRDFAIFGTTTARAEETEGVQKAFAGPLGNGSIIENLWIEHEVAGIWVGNDPPWQQAPTQNLTVRNVRIRNCYADGINLANGTSNSLVENAHFRNLGDDATAIWSVKWTDWVKDKTYARGEDFITDADPEKTAAKRNAPDQGVAHNNRFRKITVQMPWRANCFAVYGGHGHTWEDSTCEDVLTYPGIFVANQFSPYPFGPDVTTFKNISLVRAGGSFFHENTGTPWQHGALKFYMAEGPVNDILVENVDIVSPTYAGIEFRGGGTKFVPPEGEKYHPDILAEADAATFQNITLRNVKVTGAGTYGIKIQDEGGRGQVTFENVSVTDSRQGALDRETAPDSFFHKVGNNEGW